MTVAVIELIAEDDLPLAYRWSSPLCQKRTTASRQLAADNFGPDYPLTVSEQRALVTSHKNWGALMCTEAADN